MRVFDGFFDYGYEDEAFPAADVRPVVLCRDCKHWEAGWTPRGVSEGRHYCALLDLFPSADWYCSDGEKEADMKGETEQ